MHFLESAGQVRAGLRASPWNSGRSPLVARNIMARLSPPRSDSSLHPLRTRTHLLRASPRGPWAAGPAGRGGLTRPAQSSSKHTKWSLSKFTQNVFRT